MKKSLHLLSALCLLLVASQAPASDIREETGPPRYLLIERELLKPGAAPAHERESNNFARLLSNAKGVAGETRYYRIGMTPVAGNMNEVIYMFPFDTLDAVGKYTSDVERWMSRPGDQNAFFTRISAENATPRTGVNEDFHMLQATMIAERVDELSYNPRQNPGEMRFMKVTTFRVKPGQDQNFMKVGRMIAGAHREAKTGAHFVTYHVTGGALDGTYLVITSGRTLADLSPGDADRAAFGRAMGEKVSEVQKLAGEVLVNSESNVYAIRPTMSAVPDEFMRDAADRAFWTTPLPEPPAATAATTAAGGAKAAGARRRARQ